MKRWIGVVKTAVKQWQLPAFMLLLVFLLSAVITGTAAWSDISQHKTNIVQGNGSPKLSDAVLQKYEKDKNGDETTIPVPGTEFTLYRENGDGTSTGLYTYVTGSDGQILVTDLVPGNYFWQETHPAIGFLPEIENGQPKKYSFSLPAENGKPVISVAYNIRREGALALMKTVENNDGSPLSAEQMNMQFEFTVTFSDGGNYAYSINDGPTEAVASGSQIYLKSGQIAQFVSIPVGTHYEIIETAVNGYTISSENNSGNVTADGVTAAFTNTFDVPPGGTAKLTVTKIITNVNSSGGIGNNTNKEFTFTVTFTGEGAPDSPQTFTLKHGESKVFENIPYGIEYAVSEHDYTADGYIQSGIVNGTGTAAGTDIEVVQFNRYEGPEYISVYGEKTWDMTGAPAGTKLPDSVTILLKNESLTVAAIAASKDGNWEYEFHDLPKYDALGNEILYTVEEVRIPGWRPVVNGSNVENIYQPSVSCNDIEVEKAVTGTAPPQDQTFTFILKPVGEAPMPDNNEINIIGAGKASFGKIFYTIPGIYIYTITEADGGIKAWHYDVSVYTLTVIVTEDHDGRLMAVNSLTKNGNPAEKALFTNLYDDSGETISVSVTKIWKGGDSGHPQSVQVQLYKDAMPYGNSVTLSIANSWTRTWSGLDRHSVWTVDEIDVPEGYTKSVSGDQVSGFVITNSLINTYYPDEPSPKTGDESNLTFLIILMIISFTALAFTVILSKMKHNRQGTEKERYDHTHEL